MASTGNSCFWLADFEKTSPLKIQCKMEPNLSFTKFFVLSRSDYTNCCFGWFYFWVSDLNLILGTARINGFKLERKNLRKFIPKLRQYVCFRCLEVSVSNSSVTVVSVRKIWIFWTEVSWYKLTFATNDKFKLCFRIVVSFCIFYAHFKE